jgi:hypothetical protein
MATLQGQPVDRPAVSFYELDGLSQDPADPDPFNIYSDPSWQPLLELTWEKTDCIHRRKVPLRYGPDPWAALTTIATTEDAQGSRVTTRIIRVGNRTLTERTRRDRDIDTVWTVEHLLKSEEDLKAWLELPDAATGGEPDIALFLEAEKRMGDRGIVMVDTMDPLCAIAQLFDLGDYTLVAFTQPELFHRALEKVARRIQFQTEAIARALPGRLWRIYGPEYATPPYLPPRLFAEYVVRYDKPMVESIHRHGGFARIHCHGRIKSVLPSLVELGCVGIDPIEPPPQGDVELIEVRRDYGPQFVLFGNLEIADLENLPSVELEKKVWSALIAGTTGAGRGFVLMPSASPCGRRLSPHTVRNYETILAVLTAFVPTVS